ncbi:hypothetical protein [Campylobacter upsaliensis]|uniref:hypothetical protein n=1 Tax=Campylobacter upsaliensis TaxID=28080 RepID=UPI0022EB9E74|nr:hypothetical protein [Campylobacter upsaliensis]
MMNSDTATLLTNLALELNMALRRVKNLQAQISEINHFIDENGLRADFLSLAKTNQCLELLENNEIQRRVNV